MDTRYYVKKIIFILLVLSLLPCFGFFVLYSVSDFSAINKIIYAFHWQQTFFNDGLILPVYIFIPVAFAIAVLVWIFYRKEISVLCKIMITLIPVWSLVSFVLSTYFIAYDLKMLCLLLPPIFAVIAVYLVKEAIKYPNTNKQS